MGRKIIVLALIFLCCNTLLCAEEETNGLGGQEKKHLGLIREAYLKMDKFYYKQIEKESVANLFYRCQFIMMRLMQEMGDDYMFNLERLTYSTINMIVQALRDPSDTYSKFIHKDLLTRVVRENLKSSFDGIGIEIKKEEALFFIARVYAGSSADEEGVLKGDQLIAINGESVEGLELDDISKKLNIPKDATVTLSLLHPNQTIPFDVILTCRIIYIPSVTSQYYEDEKAGYIKISSFRDQTTQEFLDTLDELRRSRLRGLIIDMRGNSGGDETQAIALSGLFLEKGSLVVYFLKRGQGRLEEKTNRRPLNLNVPIVILVDEQTGSSAEIFVGGMQYHKRAVLVGQPTKGHGSLKNTIGLSDGSAMLLVTSRTYLPSDETFDQVGIQPDYVVDGGQSQLEKAFDLIDDGYLEIGQTVNLTEDAA